MPSFREQAPIIVGDSSALYRAWHERGLPRLVYGLYAVLGIIFLGISLYALLDILMVLVNSASVSLSGAALFLCDIVLNAIIGYGLIFYRKWLLVAFLSILILKVFLILVSRGSGLSVGLFVVAGISLFLFLTKDFLSREYAPLKVVIPFTVFLLASFFFGNFGVLH